MDKQTQYLNICQELQKIASEGAVNYGENVVSRIAAIEKGINEYAFKVYLVGPFSCGKSTLLNHWLGVDILPKGITPETAVATELHYSEEERTVMLPFGEGDAYGEPIVLNGVGSEQMKIVTDTANAGKLARVCLYLRNEKLKAYSDVCLVDLPGLSSTCKAHELAINQFILEKSVGIFCVPMPAGTIQQDALEFLQDMDRYRASFDLLLTKADECLSKDREAIKNHVSSTIKDRLGIPDEEFHVGIVSKDDVTAFSEQLDGLKAKRESIFEELFRGEILSVCSDMLVPLHVALAEDFDSGNVQAKLDELKNAEQKLTGICEEVFAEIGEKVPGAVDRVVCAVKDALQDKADGWFKQMRSGGDCNADICATIKRTISLRVKDELFDIFDSVSRSVSRELGKCMTFDIGETPVGSFEGVGGKVSTGVEIITATGVGLSAGAAAGAAVGCTVGTLVPVIGNAVGAAVGAVIGGLIGAFGGASSKVSENNRIRADLCEKLDAAGEQSRNEIVKLINDSIDGFEDKMDSGMRNKIAALKEQMESLKTEADKGLADFEARKAVWLAAKTELEKVGSELGMKT